MSKKMNVKYFYAIIATIGALFINNVAVAQAIPGAKIIVVDNRMISSNAAVAIDITRQVNQIRAQMQTEIKTQENALAAEEQSLKGQSAIMPQEAYNKKATEFQAKVVEYRRDVQIKSRQLEIAISNANATVERALKPIFQNILKETGATMLMDSTLMLEKIPGLDVTIRVIEQLDLEMPSIIVELPAVPEPAPATN